MLAFRWRHTRQASIRRTPCSVSYRRRQPPPKQKVYATMVRDPLQQLAEDMKNHADTIGLFCYPAGFSERALGERIVYWPDADWKTFLSLAPKVGSEVVYISAVADEEGSIYEDLDGEGEHDSDEHEGEIELVRVAYVGGGVAHVFTKFAEWHFDRISETASLHDDRQAMYDRFMARAVEQNWARRIASDKRFYTATRNMQRDVVVELLVEMSGESPEDLVNSWVRRDIFTQAVDLSTAVLEELRDRAFEEVPLIAGELMANNPGWNQMRVGPKEHLAKRAVKDRYGIPMPVVAEEVARYKRG
jgi:hypothetical protein